MATIRVYSGTVGGTGDGTSWANAYTTLLAALAAEPDGTDYILHYQHVENNTTAANVSWDFSTTLASFDTCISVDKDNSDAYRRGAFVDHNANGFTQQVGGFLFCAGVDWENGNGGSNFATDSLYCDNDDDEQVYIDCKFRMHNTGNSGIIAFGDGDTRCTLIDCEVIFAGTAYIQIFGCDFRWYGGTYTSETSAPTQLFLPVVEPSKIYCEGVDFSSTGTSVDIIDNSTGSSHTLLRNCKLATSWAGNLGVTNPIDTAQRVILENCGNADINYGFLYGDRAGEIEHQVDLYPTGTVGGKHNTADVPLSYKMISNADTDPQFNPLFSPPIALFNEDTTSQTLTWEFIHNDAAALQDDDVWMQIAYLGTSGAQQSTLDDTAFDDKFGTFDPYATPANITTSTKDWDDGLTARANSTAYSVGDIRKESGSLGSAFICTVAGTSDSSVPAGFTSASDGDSITDNTVTWKAMRRQKCAITFTAAEQGVIKAHIVLAKASTTIWASAELEAS